MPYVTSFVYLCDVILSIRESCPKGRFLCYIRKQLPGRKLFAYVYTFLCRAESSGGFLFRVQCAGGDGFGVKFNFVVNLVHMFLQFGHLLFNTDFLLSEHIQPQLQG